MVLIWVLGLTFALQIGAPYIRELSLGVPGAVRKFALILLLAWTLLRFVARFERVVLLQRESIDRTTASAISKLLRLVIFVLTGLTLLQSLGYSISGILAFGGVGGIAVCFAAKDLLANFFGGLMIYLDRPFKVGDWIRSPDKNIEA